MRTKVLYLSITFWVIGGIFAQAATQANKGPVGLSAWLVFWDPDNASVASFEKHADQIDRVYCEWYELGKTCLPQPLDAVKPELKARVLKAAKDHGVEVWAMISDYDTKLQIHDPASVESILRDPDLCAKNIRVLVQDALDEGVQGIQVDYQGLTADDKDAFTVYMRELAKLCHAKNLLCGAALPPKTDDAGDWDDPASRDYHELGHFLDRVVPLTFNLHWADSNPGCLTSPDYSELVAFYATSAMSHERLELGYPVFGYDWVGKKGQEIDSSAFGQGIVRNHAVPKRDWDDSQELYYEYKSGDGKHHEAWLPDERTLVYQCDLVKKYHLDGLCVWRLGQEPESFWVALKKINSATPLTAALLPAEPEADKSARLKVVKLFTDERDCEYVGAYPKEETKSADIFKKGKRWLDLKLKGTAWSGAYMGVDQFDLSRYCEKGALQFYIRGDKGGERLHGVGFSMPKDLKNHYLYATTVPLGNYCQVTTKWQKVTIPLADIPNGAQHFEEDTFGHKLQALLNRPISSVVDQTYHARFNWKKVIEFVVDHEPNSDPAMEIEIANVVVLPSYDPHVVVKERESGQ